MKTVLCVRVRFYDFFYEYIKNLNKDKIYGYLFMDIIQNTNKFIFNFEGIISI